MAVDTHHVSGHIASFGNYGHGQALSPYNGAGQCVESHPVGPAYCPNLNEADLPKEYETHVQIVQKVPEMQEVEETHYKKVVCYEKAKVCVPKSVLTFDLVEHFEMVPVVRNLTKTRQEVEYRVSEEEIEITVIEQCVEYETVCVIRQEAKVKTEEVEEIISVPVVKEVKVTKMCEEWTGKYCEAEVEKFCSPGDWQPHLRGKLPPAVL